MITRRSFVSAIAGVTAAISLPSLATANLQKQHNSFEITIHQLQPGELPWYPRWDKTMLICTHMGKCYEIPEGETVLVPSFETVADIYFKDPLEHAYLAARAMLHMQNNNMQLLRSEFVKKFGSEPTSCVIHVRDYSFRSRYIQRRFPHGGTMREHITLLTGKRSQYIDSNNMVGNSIPCSTGTRFHKTIGMVMFGGKEIEPSQCNAIHSERSQLGRRLESRMLDLAKSASTFQRLV